jgi:hypothetical protein
MHAHAKEKAEWFFGNVSYDALLTKQLDTIQLIHEMGYEFPYAEYILDSKDVEIVLWAHSAGYGFRVSTMNIADIDDSGEDAAFCMVLRAIVFATLDDSTAKRLDRAIANASVSVLTEMERIGIRPPKDIFHRVLKSCKQEKLNDVLDWYMHRNYTDRKKVYECRYDDRARTVHEWANRNDISCRFSLDLP